MWAAWLYRAKTHEFMNLSTRCEGDRVVSENNKLNSQISLPFRVPLLATAPSPCSPPSVYASSHSHGKGRHNLTLFIALFNTATRLQTLASSVHTLYCTVHLFLYYSSVSLVLAAIHLDSVRLHLVLANEPYFFKKISININISQISAKRTKPYSWYCFGCLPNGTRATVSGWIRWRIYDFYVGYAGLKKKYI